LNSIVYHLKIAYRVTNSFSSFLHSTFALPLSLLYLALEDGSPYKHKSKGLIANYSNKFKLVVLL
jgi:hypothetical protein